MEDLILTVDEQKTLEKYARSATTEHRKALRAKIILMYAEDTCDRTVATKLSISPHTVAKWRKRFIEKRLDGLSDLPRSGQPRKISDLQIQDIVNRTIGTKPKNSTHWSSSQMAKVSGVSSGTVKRIWRAFGLQPQRSEHFQISKDPRLVEKVRDIVGLYMCPPDNALVLWDGSGKVDS